MCKMTANSAEHLSSGEYLTKRKKKFARCRAIIFVRHAYMLNTWT
jgi:hypothetical protein